MLGTGEGLRVGRTLQGNRAATFIVSGTRALSLCERQGFRRIAPSEALCLLRALDRFCRHELRTFVLEARLCGLPITTMDDARLLDLVCGFVRSGRLVGVRQDGQAALAANQGALRQRQLIRKLGAACRGKLSLAGRTYKLVADVDLDKLPHRQDYEVVRHDDAVRVLAGLGAQHGGAEARELLSQASAHLTRDWRPPFSEPDGLVLVRRLPVVAATGVESLPVTPSQLAKLRAQEQSVSFEVVVLGLDDKPQPGLAYAIDAPDGETHEDDLGSGGKTKVTSAKKGPAAVMLRWSDGKGT